MSGLLRSMLNSTVYKRNDLLIYTRDLILFSPSKGKGFAISYPSIALHALGSHASTPAVYLQLNLHDADLLNTENDYDVDTLDVHVIPTTTEESPSPAKDIFEALSACADLHPDPDSGSEVGEDTAPGAGGWITSENMQEFMDDDGNFVGGGSLGAGAGTVREREEDAEDDQVNGDGGESDTKWQRTG